METEILKVLEKIKAKLVDEASNLERGIHEIDIEFKSIHIMCDVSVFYSLTPNYIDQEIESYTQGHLRIEFENIEIHDDNETILTLNNFNYESL